MKRKLIIVLIVLTCIASYIYFFKNDKTHTPKEKIKSSRILNSTTLKEEQCSEEDIVNFLKKFVANFNTNNPRMIDTYINNETLCLFFYYDGCYPILTIDNSINNQFDWYNVKINTEISQEKFPKYLGDGKFEKNGVFYAKNDNYFKIDNFDNSYTNHSEEELKPYKNLESKCNYYAKAMDTEGTKIYSFYFSINKKTKSLIGISYEYLEDSYYSNPNYPFVPFETDKEITEYLLNSGKFCDKEQDAYIDFQKKEITYIDFDKGPFIFESFTIDKAEKLSDKISIREVHFLTDISKFDFSMTISNKGIFYKLPMGARPGYVYRKCVN